MQRWIWFCLLVPILSWAGGQNLKEVRTLYYSAAQSKSDGEALNTALEACPKDQPVYAGYRGAVYMLKAQHAFMPTSKLQYFNTGKGMIDAAIKSAPAEIELVFLRFTIQTNCPSFLGYNTNIASDKSKIISVYKTITDAELKTMIRNYMVTSSYCTAAEQEYFK